MKAKFESFLSRLETEKNISLIETIREGYKVVTESYADVVEETVSAIDSFNNMGAMASANIGNNVMNFLQNSSSKLSDLYTVDEEPELDNMPTSYFNQYEEEIIPKDEITEDLGLTTYDLAKRTSPQ
jgi:hypothetical protein